VVAITIVMGLDQSIWYGAYLLCTGHKKIAKSVSFGKYLRCASGHEMAKRDGMDVGKHCVECGKPIVEEFDFKRKIEKHENFGLSTDNKDGDIEPVLITVVLDKDRTAYVSNVSDDTRESIDAEENFASEMKDPSFYREKFTKKLGKYAGILEKYHDKVELKVGIVVEWN